MSRMRDAEQLMAAASERTGLSDFGDEQHRPGLDALRAAVGEDGEMGDIGAAMYDGMVVDALAGYLTSEAGWQQDDRWRSTAVERPVFILGLPRTGTTALQKLLAQNPSVQSLPYWLGVYPQPRPARETWEEHPRFQETAASLDAIYRTNPALRVMHDMAADEADECRLLLLQTCADLTFATTARLPSYRDWLLSADQVPFYERYRRNLQLIASGDERRWVLKCPSHLLALDALLECFPDACIVQTHRAPEEAIPSVCSLVRGAVAMAQPHLSPAELGSYQLDLWHRVVEHGQRVRRDADPSRFYDVDFRALVADPLGEVDRICAQFDVELTDDGRRHVRAWHERRPRGHSGEHRYTAADFGLSEGMIHERFADYRDRHGLA